MSRHAVAHHDMQALIRGIPIRYPVGSYLCIEFSSAKKGREFLKTLDVSNIPSLEDTTRPLVLNVAFSFPGLEALGLGTKATNSFPTDFAEGMRRRVGILGDNGLSAPKYWDKAWSKGRRVHALLGCYAQDNSTRDAWLASMEKAASTFKFTIIERQAIKRLLYEPGVTRLGIDEEPTIDSNGWIFEHFGFADGISNPPVLGLNTGSVVGRGRLDQNGEWHALAAGEFILGYEDEAGEYAVEPAPIDLARNGTFMVYRKLSQNVSLFRRFVKFTADHYGVSADLIAAKMMGRQRDGQPLGPRRGESLNNFVYSDDPEGRGCPLGSHARRSCPRDQLGFGTALIDRHRLLRRGITYGDYLPPEHGLDYDSRRGNGWKDERGLIFISLGASISRQFEFVQEQWINYGNELRQGNTRDPICGSSNGGGMVFPGDGKRPTMFTSSMKRFVATRGGDYFFMPGLRALSAIAHGQFSAPKAAGTHLKRPPPSSEQ